MVTLSMRVRMVNSGSMVGFFTLVDGEEEGSTKGREVRVKKKLDME